MTVERIVAANRALEQARKAVAEYNGQGDEIKPAPPDPSRGIALFVPLAPEKC